MKEWLGGYHVVLKSAKKVHVDRPILAIVYKNIYHKFLVFIALKGAGSTEPGFPYLYHLSNNYSKQSWNYMNLRFRLQSTPALKITEILLHISIKKLTAE